MIPAPGARRIALVAACPFPSPQGSQVFIGEMARRLAAAGHEIHLLTYGQGAEQLGQGYRHHRIPRLPGDDASRSGPNPVKPFLDAMLAARLVRLCRERRIDLVHAHNYEAALAAIAARAVTGVPVVYHSHNLMGDELETYFEGHRAKALAGIAGRLLDRSVPRRADAAIALCHWSAARLAEAGCDPARLHVIPPAVEDEGPLEASPRDREALGLGADEFVAGYCGNLDAYQNLPLLFRAMALLQERGAGRTKLLVATHAGGEGLRERLLEHGLGEVSRVVRVAGRAEARRALAACDVVALPRRLGSGYPVKLLNSMSAAKAVVSAGCGAKVLRDGVDGILVPDDDARALAEAIEALRRRPDRRRALGEAARRTFLERLTWERVLPQVEDVHAGLGDPGKRR